MVNRDHRRRIQMEEICQQPWVAQARLYVPGRLSENHHYTALHFPLILVLYRAKVEELCQQVWEAQLGSHAL